jgi:hypothetical protein
MLLPFEVENGMFRAWRAVTRQHMACWSKDPNYPDVHILLPVVSRPVHRWCTCSRFCVNQCVTPDVDSQLPLTCPTSLHRQSVQTRRFFAGGSSCIVHPTVPILVRANRFDCTIKSKGMRGWTRRTFVAITVVGNPELSPLQSSTFSPEF